MARYRRIVADNFLDGPRAWTRTCPVRKPTPDATGDRASIGGILPGTALIAGPDLLPSQVRTIPASAQVVHGGASATFAVAGANQDGPIYIANIATLAGGNASTPWYGFDAVEGLFWAQGRALNVLVPTGVSVTKGMGLTTNASGWFIPAATGQRIIMTADETYNNNTGSLQLVRTLPGIGA